MGIAVIIDDDFVRIGRTATIAVGSHHAIICVSKRIQIDEGRGRTMAPEIGACPSNRDLRSIAGADRIDAGKVQHRQCIDNDRDGARIFTGIGIRNGDGVACRSIRSKDLTRGSGAIAPYVASAACGGDRCRITIANRVNSREGHDR